MTKSPFTPVTGPVVRGRSTAQKDLVRSMLNERFSKTDAAARYDHFDWDKMPEAQFQGIIEWLRLQPKLNDPSRWGRKPAQMAYTGLFFKPGAEHGIFTVEFPNGDYRAFQILQQDPDADFMPGKVLIGFQNGPSNEFDYRTFAHVADDGRVCVWKRFKDETGELRDKRLLRDLKVLLGTEDADEDGTCEHAGICARCHKTLTVPSSKNQGYGDICWGKINGG